MPDTLEKIQGSLIQHGPANQRIYLMKIASNAGPEFLDRLDELARSRSYTKIFTKTPARFKPLFEERGYKLEAAVPLLYDGKEEGHFWGKFLDPARAESPHMDSIQAVIEAAEAKTGKGLVERLGAGLKLRVLAPADIPAMVSVYRLVFESYPFPIDDPSFLAKAMSENVVFFGVFEGDKLVAISSSEMDEEGSNVEMTDFATLPTHRCFGLATHLLAAMEKAMNARGIATAYTIARARSFGMNITFAKLGYKLGGTLINNTDISGGLESMNVWYKPL